MNSSLGHFVARPPAGMGQYSHSYSYDAIGNITARDGQSYTYGSQPHAVTAAQGNSYGYDGNGNMTTRVIAGVTYTLSYDYENRLVEVKQGAAVMATFLYDADGSRVKGTVNGVTTVYIAGVYEWQNGATTSYYTGPTGPLALRRAGHGSDDGVFYMLSDHLGSTSALVAQNGALNSTNYYHPYGDARSPLSSLTTKRFTGQYHEVALGLYFYNARWYDPLLGRFAQADTFIPSPANPQAFNRYAYTLNNPLRFTDPSGHCIPGWNCPGDGGGGGAPSPPTPPPPPPTPPWQPPHWPPPPQPVPTPPDNAKGTPTPGQQNNHSDGIVTFLPNAWTNWFSVQFSVPHPLINIPMRYNGLVEFAFVWDINVGTNTDAYVELLDAPGITISPDVTLGENHFSFSDVNFKASAGRSDHFAVEGELKHGFTADIERLGNFDQPMIGLFLKGTSTVIVKRYYYIHDESLTVRVNPLIPTLIFALDKLGKTLLGSFQPQPTFTNAY